MEQPDGTKPKSAAAPDVEAAGDDVLGEILLRLPDTESLARAALARKRWRRVASDPFFLRRFHSLHDPALLGFIMLGPRRKRSSYKGPDHRFFPVSSRNPHIAAATAATDYNLQDFAARNPRSGACVDRWVLRGCDGGRFLLSYGGIYREELAVYDSIARTTELVQEPAYAQFGIRNAICLHYVLVAGEDNASFRVFAVKFDSLYQTIVYSSRTGEWASLPSLDVPRTPVWNVLCGMRAGRFAYWKSNRIYNVEVELTLVLDTSTLKWTLIEVPFPASAAKESYCVADIAEHGGLCLVASREQCIQLWVRNSDGWVIKKQTFLLEEFAILKKLRRDEWMKKVRILEVRDGYVYMEFWTIRKPNSYLLVLNWQTMKLRVLANDTEKKYRGPAFPFFMTWAPPLLSPEKAEASSSRPT